MVGSFVFSSLIVTVSLLRPEVPASDVFDARPDTSLPQPTTALMPHADAAAKVEGHSFRRDSLLSVCTVLRGICKSYILIPDDSVLFST
jgi:hypothetical protein